MKAMKLRYLVILVLFSCNTVKNPFFSPASPHQEYENSLKNAGLSSTKMATLWLEAARRALDSPATVQIPFKETGYFNADLPSAGGYSFEVKRGEKIYITIDAKKDTSAQLFAELYKLDDNSHRLLKAFQSVTDTVTATVKRDGRFLIRIQAELLVNVEYTVQISSGPSLAFPVDSSGKPHFISYWGAGRDAGKRKHEGVDIGAKFRTPALAAANGHVFRVGDNRLGGKVVMMRDDETGNSLYYAHLDSQIAVSGMRVKIGDTLGLIGNTGNAKHTPPHLHFGIYTSAGAVNPYPFVNPVVSQPPPIKASGKYLNLIGSATKNTSAYDGPSAKLTTIGKIGAREPVWITALAEDFYKVQTADQKVGYIQARHVTIKPLQKSIASAPLKVFERPDTASIAKGIIHPGDSLQVMGEYNGHRLIVSPRLRGWIR